MIKIYDAANHIDAQLALDELLAADIEAIMKGQFLSGGAGELPPSGLVTLWVLDESFEDKAKAVITEYENRNQSCAPAQDCAGCGERVEGNFACCWNCGAELPEISKSF